MRERDADVPGDWVGRACGLQVLIVQQPDSVLLADSFVCYPHGIEFKVWLVNRHQGSGFPVESEAARDELFREKEVRIEFADGRAATARGLTARSHRRLEEVGEGPMLSRQNYTHTPFNGWVDTYWVWPLPPLPKMRLTVQWPQAGIPRTERVCGTRLLHHAAAQALMVGGQAGPSPSEAS